MRLSRGCVLLVLLTLGGCFLRPARTPMEHVAFTKLGPAAARGAVVLLPGFGDSPDDFAEHGMVATLQRRAPGFDVFAADAHFGYYRSHTLVERLEHDVIGPLRARGYREIWLLGISMGGYGVVAYARSHPQNIRGVILLAPYMGPGDIIDEVAKVGLCKYAPAIGKEGGRADHARENFLWLKQQACVDRQVSLWLGVGDEDHLLGPNRLLTRELSPSHVFIVPGGHAWKTWTPAMELLSETAFDTSGPMH